MTKTLRNRNQCRSFNV